MKQPRKMTYAPLYFGDFKEGCEDLSNEEIGAYLRVLFEIYEHMGPIDFNDRKLAKRFNSRPHKARSMVESLIQMGKLYLTREGQISNHRAENEIVKFVSISVQNQLNGSSPKLKSNSPLQKPNEFNDPDKRPLSENGTILDKNNNNTSSLEVSALPPRTLFSASEKSKRALEDLAKRQAQRSTKKPVFQSQVSK